MGMSKTYKNSNSNSRKRTSGSKRNISKTSLKKVVRITKKGDKIEYPEYEGDYFEKFNKGR